MILRISSLTLLTIFGFVGVYAQGPNGSDKYYKDADGKKGRLLKTALCGVISRNYNQQSYSALWTAYRTTDTKPGGVKMYDIYSNTSDFTYGTDQAGNYKKEGDKYNREHTFPKSWFGGKSYPMYTDLFHVMPSDGYVNSKRGNYPFGENNGEKYSSNNAYSKLGRCTTSGYSGIVFEPNDEYKGDMARNYFYMATRYENEIANWSGDGGDVLSHDSYKPYKDWQMAMLLEWSKNDPVSPKEIDRNKAVYAIQKNRNPFIDYPGLEEYIWGDKQNQAFSYDNYESVDAIILVETEEQQQNNFIYDLQGRRVEVPTHGIYIINGKKIFIK
ncbi:MAG: endonuclease [Prevotella sp.]|uniref:HNH endonuclease signature motif containing protein n=1 Tax=Prevotella sp. TaxID=59823 RepID=UPI002A2B6090|nr:endonuclease [Prevotella sp.]MDD7318165.1 endonuclease [Prevotellaceae bacterium]MDY4020946.1 endonuclease [Prevotella sp.]